MKHNRHDQRGVILIGLMVVLIVASGLTFLHRANGSNATAIERDAKTMAALLAARDALLARATLDQNRPGSLPCPDTDNDGIADLAFPNCTAYVGWLPWRTLDLNDPRDAVGERLWYVLSPNFNDGNTAINSNTTTSLTLDGQAGMVALIIAPGGTLGAQNRPSNSIADYLDDANGNPATSNRDGDNHFFSGPTDTSFNDRIIALDSTTLFNVLAMRLLGEIRQAVNAAGGPLPYADSDNNGYADAPANIGQFPYLEAAYDLPSPTWPASHWYDGLATNGWFSLITYSRTAGSITVSGRKISLP
ncbi:MAG: hypothetical protein CVU18_00540 [Betaproteobacteria bacterium HGW-Betaproteobacteria-12]|nr:MAG: hypothetical protein CVU18_00540 [Betaproteobacteria bacterium HGW-Betaproteobacteria-12]